MISIRYTRLEGSVLITNPGGRSRRQIKLPDGFNRLTRSVLGSNIERKSDVGGTASREFHVGRCILVLTRKLSIEKGCS